jgi:O-antigen ligase
VRPLLRLPVEPAALAEALPLLPLVAVFIGWGAHDGGYSPVAWLPGALFALATLLTLVLALREELVRPRPVVVAECLLLAYTVWCYASIGWAQVRGDALDGANRTLLYLCVFVLFSRRHLQPRLVLAFLGVYAVVIAVVGLVDLWGADDVRASFVAGRLATPISYPDANAALFLIAALPTVVIATRRRTPPLVRGLLLASAGVLVELALLCQSRASLVALPLAGLVLLALTPRRVALVIAAAVVAIPVLASLHRVLAVYPAVFSGHGVDPRLAEARSAVGWTALALLFAGIALGLIDRRLLLPGHAQRVLRTGSAVAAAAAVCAGVAVFVVEVGNPAAEARTAWHRFKNLEPGVESSRSSHLFSGVGGPRYDIWRVAVDEFRRSPLRGVGVDNFAVDYLRLGRTKAEPMYPHSLELRLLAQTGIVGTLLFGGFLAAALTAAARAFRLGTTAERGVVGACLAVFAYWFAHGSVDWLWAFPGLAAPALAWLALATRASPASSSQPARGLPVLRYGLVAPALAAGLLLAATWLAAHEVENATAGWRGNPHLAYRRLDLAARLNPWSDAAPLTSGVIAARAGDGPRARRAFGKALARNPYSWFAHVELASVESVAGRRRRALAQLRRAQALDPRQPVIINALASVRRGERLTPDALDQAFLDRLQVLTGEKQH